MKTILFVLEINKSRGLGHWYRCLELANQLKYSYADLKIIWLLDTIDDNFKKVLNENDIYFKIDDYRRTETIIKEIYISKADLIIFDLMELGRDYIVEINKHIKTITIGGSGIGLSYSDISINGMFKRDEFIKQFYGKKLYMGEEYIILRSDIYDNYEEKELNLYVEKVLISLGADYEGKGIELANILIKHYDQLRIDVLSLVSTRNKNISGVRALKHICNPWHLFKDVDVIISAGGMTAFEASYLGIPLLLVSTTEIQMQTCKKFQEKGLGLYAGMYNGDIENKLIETFRRIEKIEIRERIQENRNNVFKKENRDIVTQIILKEL